MNIADAQREMRTRYAGGFYGQLVSGLLWLLSASLATWGTSRAAITTLVLGGFLIFPLTDLLANAHGKRPPLSPANSLKLLGMQVAFVLPLSMPLLLPVAQFRLNLFFPAMTILLGAHYCPFAFLYGMPAFGVLAGVLVTGGVAIAMNFAHGFSTAAWFTAITLLVFAMFGRAAIQHETARRAEMPGG